MTTPSRPAVGSTESASKKPDITGHRRRMRDKVIDKSAATLTEFELLEMILYPSNPRGDTKPMAKRLMKEFGSFAGVLRAPVETLQQLDKVGPAAIAAIKVTEVAALQKSRAFVSRAAASDTALCFFDIFRQFTGHLASFPTSC